MDPILEVIEKYPATTALVAAVLIPLIAALAARFGTVSLRDELENLENLREDSWHSLIARYSGTARETYWNAINRVLTFADRFYGPKISAQAFARCLSLAYAYPVLAVLLGWVIANAGTVGGLPLLPDTPAWWDRAWRAVVLVLSFLPLAWVMANEARIDALVNRFFDKFVDTDTRRPGFLSKAGRRVSEFLAGAHQRGFTSSTGT